MSKNSTTYTDTDNGIESKLKEYEALDKQLSALGGSYKGLTGKNKQITNNIEFIPTKCISIDRCLKGMVPGRIYEVFGPTGSCKSSFTLFLMASMQREGHLCMWIDVEACFTMEYAELCGVDVDKLILIRPENMNEALEAVRIASASGLVKFICIDSIAAMVPKDEFDKDVGGGMIGTRARLLSSALPQIVKHCGDSGCILVCINQERACNMTGYGPKSTTTGGAAIPYYASVRIDMNRSGYIEGKGGEKIGMEVKAQTIKNKTYTPFKTATLNFIYPNDEGDGGLDLIADVVTNAIELKVVIKAGSWMKYGESVSVQGEPKLRELLKDDPILLEEIRYKTMEVINGGSIASNEEEGKQDIEAINSEPE